MIGAILVAASVAIWIDGLRSVGRAHVGYPSWESRGRISAAGIGLFHGNGRIRLFVEWWSRPLEPADDARNWRRSWDVMYSRWDLKNLAPDHVPETFFSGPLQWRFRGCGLYDSVRQGTHQHGLEFPMWLPALMGVTLIAVPVGHQWRRTIRGGN